MSGWWGFALTVGVGVVLGVVQVVHDRYFDASWTERAEREAQKMGLPAITHKARRRGRVVSVMSVDPDTGRWLWKAHRP